MDAPNAHGATVQICGVNEQPADLSLVKKAKNKTNKQNKTLISSV